MISKLRISNFALIESLELEINDGFTVLTGETGSGKSILLNALSCIMGERVLSTLVGPYGDKAIVEVHLRSQEKEESFYRKYDLDYEAVTILRREIHKEGKSRSFINDSPVPLSVLKEYTRNKILIHSQYNTFELRSKKTQLALYDLLAGLKSEVEDFGFAYREYTSAKEELKSLRSELDSRARDMDYQQFLLQELKELSLESIDYTDLENRLFNLENAEEIREILRGVQAFNEDAGVSELTGELAKRLDKLQTSDPELNQLKERLNSLSIDLKDLSMDSSRLLDTVHEDPESKSRLTAQLNDFNGMMAKHKVNTQDELRAVLVKLENSSVELSEYNNRVKASQERLEVLEAEIEKRAEEIHSIRINAQEDLSNTLSEELTALKLPHTEIEFDMSRVEMNETGITGLNLMFSANLGQKKIEIEKAASGGELSRFMLALLKLVSEKRKMQSILFDEIDAGVSGDVAEKIGILLKNMGKNSQLLVISHLPQVASKAEKHLMLTKSIKEERSKIFVTQLSENERVEEVARLMSGEEVTQTAIETARSLMD